MKTHSNITVLTLATMGIFFSTELVATAFSVGLDSTGGFYFGTGDGAAGGIANALCNIAGWFQGGVGQAIASLAIIFLGISAFFGKVTWGTALLFAVGVFAIFGSADIVKAIVSGTSSGDGWSGFLSSSGWGVSYSSGTSCGGF